MNYWDCDYCQTSYQTHQALPFTVATGWDRDEPGTPTFNLWCGYCSRPTDIDMNAHIVSHHYLLGGWDTWDEEDEEEEEGNEDTVTEPLHIALVYNPEATGTPRMDFPGEHGAEMRVVVGYDPVEDIAKARVSLFGLGENPNIKEALERFGNIVSLTVDNAEEALNE